MYVTRAEMPRWTPQEVTAVVTVSTPPRTRRLWGLALATCAVGTSGHAVAGLLPIMAAELHTGAMLIGQLATIFALVCAVSAPLLAVATGRWERRRLLVVCLQVTAIGNAVAAVAPTYLALVAGRVVTALGAAMTTAVAVGIAAAATPPRRRARAMAAVLCGLTVGLLVGVPGAAAIAYWAGYRLALWAVAAVCVGAAVAVILTAPTLPAPPPVSLRARIGVAARPGVLGVLGGGLLAWVSSGVVYPYLAVVVGGPDWSGPTSLYLAAYGAGAAVGTLGGGRLVDWIGPRPTLYAATLTAAGALLAVPAAAGPISGPAVVAVWGAAAWATTPALNAWLDRIAPAGGAALLLALAGSAIYLGMGLGSLLGGVVLVRSGPGALTTVAAVLAVAAAALIDRSKPRRSRPRKARGRASDHREGQQITGMSVTLRRPQRARRSAPRRLIGVGSLLAMTLSAGCGDNPPPDPLSSPTVETSVAMPPPDQRGPQVTVAGTVTWTGSRPGCVHLETASGQNFQLTGAAVTDNRQRVAAGRQPNVQRVTITGYVPEAGASVCSSGRAFVAEEVTTMVG
ncbi:MFS transporter, DHA1 family [Alloactinosynnema sp. L-07]|uniref:MFS transporter n=1 Tax=Alloactinosynnema sp. L-07 TaxID=1653480 RepID=UPI00065EF659|nr:MFS transporter [Alloactinosynnema sp. L-07]CRK57010.1 MFS transporter, DHA1 family [Alloactinosynnema sp. L-07]